MVHGVYEYVYVEQAACIPSCERRRLDCGLGLSTWLKCSSDTIIFLLLGIGLSR